MPINRNEITKELLEKAMKCKTPDELIALAKTEDIELTKDEAEAYLAVLADVELDSKMLREVAGGVCWKNCPGEDPNCGVHACGMAGWTDFKGC